MKADTPVLPAINNKIIKRNSIKIIGKLHHNLYFHRVLKNSAEMANRERVIAAVGQIARESALSNEEQQRVIAEQEQRELVHH